MALSGFMPEAERQEALPAPADQGSLPFSWDGSVRATPRYAGRAEKVQS
jgi:hypothetical protein